MRVVWIFLVAAGCGTPSAPAPAPVVEPGVTQVSTQSGTYDVAVRFEPAQPEMGALFDVVATVTDRRTKTPLELGQVTLNARMPQHGHGMETDPAQDAGVCSPDPACPHAGGVYRTKGFKFHMGGAWTVTVDVVGAAGTDSTSFVYEMR